MRYPTRPFSFLVTSNIFPSFGFPIPYAGRANAPPCQSGVIATRGKSARGEKLQAETVLTSGIEHWRAERATGTEAGATRAEGRRPSACNRRRTTERCRDRDARRYATGF